MKENDEEKAAATKRLLIEANLLVKYQAKLVEVVHPHCYNNGLGLRAYGIIRTIGVESTGADQFEVIINLDGTRIVFPYQEFIDNVTILQ